MKSLLLACLGATAVALPMGSPAQDGQATSAAGDSQPDLVQRIAELESTREALRKQMRAIERESTMLDAKTRLESLEARYVLEEEWARQTAAMVAEASMLRREAELVAAREDPGRMEETRRVDSARFAEQLAMQQEMDVSRTSTRAKVEELKTKYEEHRALLAEQLESVETSEKRASLQRMLDVLQDEHDRAMTKAENEIEVMEARMEALQTQRMKEAANVVQDQFEDRRAVLASEREALLQRADMLEREREKMQRRLTYDAERADIVREIQQRELEHRLQLDKDRTQADAERVQRALENLQLLRAAATSGEAHRGEGVIQRDDAMALVQATNRLTEERAELERTVATLRGLATSAGTGRATASAGGDAAGAAAGSEPIWDAIHEIQDQVRALREDVDELKRHAERLR